MAFPQVKTTASGNSGGNSLTHSITLPTGIVKNDLIIVFWSNDGGATASVTTPASGWSSLGGNVSPSNNNRVYAFYRWADGNEASTITVTVSSTEGAAWTVYRIDQADPTVNPTIATAATNTTATPDPPNHTSGFGSVDTLWVAFYGWDGNQSHSSYPANYSTSPVTNRWANVAGTGVASGLRQLNASSENPGTAAILASDQWAAYTLAISPGTAATGTVAVTEANDTSSASGVVILTGTVAVTEANDVGAASGTTTAAADPTGTVAVTEANDTSTASGALIFTGTVSVTEANDVGAASGQMEPSGTVAVTEQADTSTASGALVFTGTVAVTEQNDTSTASGDFGLGGTVAVTEQDDTSTASGALIFTGTVSVTEANDVGAASGLAFVPTTGTVAVTEQDDTSTASGQMEPSGTVAVTEQDDTSTASGQMEPSGTVAVTEQDDTSTASGLAFVPVTGTTAVTENDDVGVASGQMEPSGTVAVTEEDDAGAANGVTFQAVTGTVTVTEANDVSAASGTSFTVLFPTVESSSSGNSGGNDLTHTITLPTGIVSGNLIVVFWSNDGGATASVTTPASGWSSLGGGVSPSNNNRVYAFYRWADGNEASTITVTVSSTEGAAWTAYRISGADGNSNPEISTAATGTSTSPNPNSLTPSWGEDATLWFSFYGWDGNNSHSSYPASYSSDQLTNRWANLAGTGIASASRDSFASSEDPGAATISGSDQWVAYTLAIKPGIFVGVSESIGFVQTLTLSRVYRNAADRMFFYGAYPGPLGGPTGEIGQEATTNYFYVDILDSIGFSQISGYDQQVDVHEYIGFTDRYFADLSQTVFGRFETSPERSRVNVVVSVDAFNEFSFNSHDNNAAKRVYSAYDVIGFTDTVLDEPTVGDIYDVIAWEEAVDTIGTELGGSVTHQFIRQHVSYRIQGKACPEKEYTPFVGVSDDVSYPEVPTTPPTLGQGVLTLTHPRVAPTLTLTLKNPDFGNADVLRFSKIDRRTRGGDRKIFSDLGWGSTQSFELTITNVCETTATIDEIIDFLNVSLGEEIGLLDWENRQWKGIIVAPETDVKPQVGGHTVRIIFEGELV